MFGYYLFMVIFYMVLLSALLLRLLLFGSIVRSCVCFLSLELPKNKPLYIFCGLNCLKQKIKQRQREKKNNNTKLKI